MRKIKEVLRLHYELGLGQRRIARCCSISRSTVHGYLQRAETAGLPWPLPPDCDEAQLEERLFGGGVARPPGQRRSEPDFAAIHERLQTHKHVTLQLPWQEYIEARPGGYRYSRFRELYPCWRGAASSVSFRASNASAVSRAWPNSSSSSTSAPSASARAPAPACSNLSAGFATPACRAL